MKSMIGIEYGRGATAVIVDKGPALAPSVIKKLFPERNWSIVSADPFNAEECAKDRFGENYKIQKKIYANTPKESHILIGGDHSVNFGHFAALADQYTKEDLCLIYIDAHLDIHTPQSSKSEASGAPHGTNVRALLGEGDSRWLSLQKKSPALKPENIFYLGTRSYENAEIHFIKTNNIFMRTPSEISTQQQLDETIKEIRTKIGAKPFVISFDFDALDTDIFDEVLVPEPNGISLNTAKYLLKEFDDAISFEFVEYSPKGKKSGENIAKQLIEITL